MSSTTFLRRRKDATTENAKRVEVPPTSPLRNDTVVWGKTPSGEVFRVPTTHDVLTLFNPKYPKSQIDLLNLATLGAQIVLFALLPRHVSKIFFALYFVFWRAAYDGGLGWVLTKQSKKKWIVKEVKRRGWLDEKRGPEMRQWIRKQLSGKMGKDYSFDELPLEYNAWLLFRQAVDIILLNDFVAYCMFAFSCFRVPVNLSMVVHAMRWLSGFALIAFNLWVKTEAHNVVKDYGWYWGDAFFQRGALVFDGVFELAPHPMYSVGYAGYYGLSLIVGSYPVLFMSLAAHAAQFAFLVFFENPHIERMYGQRKLIAQRTPLQSSTRRTGSASLSSSMDALPNTASLSRLPSSSPLEPDNDIPPTPTATDGDTATSTDLETELDTEMESDSPLVEKKSVSGSVPLPSKMSLGDRKRSRSKALTQYDLTNEYFRRDTILFRNFDIFRASDFQLLLILAYAVSFVALPSLSKSSMLKLHVVHALAWCIFHTFGLGIVLKAQSDTKFLLGHFVKHYYYPHKDASHGAIQEAFTNFKVVFNLSMCMTYISFGGVVWNTYSLPTQWTVGDELLRHTLGALLVSLHIWVTLECYEVLGIFGWFFGDFFMEDFPANLEYTGIYRYLNNPEVMNGAAFFGLALVSGSTIVWALAAVAWLSRWWFLTFVENPHMRKLYGDSLRKEAGFVKVIKNVASKNARLLESRAGRHAPEIRRVAREVIGTFDKVYDETAEIVEEFLAKSKPRISEVMQDTKILLQQSRERLIITRVASDLSSYDPSKYHISIVPNRNGHLRFHLGEPISVKFQAPIHHSRRDWIGIYRVGANKSTLVTKTSSMGMWIPVHDDEWDGDIPLHSDQPAARSKLPESGEVQFKSGALPWRIGTYEMRYHHDGKYNVMSIDGPFDVYVDRPDTLDFASVRQTLMRIVPLCLDSDPSLIPLSCLSTQTWSSDSSVDRTDDSRSDDGRDPDDFRFWSERQAKRICGAIQQIFDVEYVPSVVMADANLASLANRILVSKELFTG